MRAFKSLQRTWTAITPNRDLSRCSSHYSHQLLNRRAFGVKLDRPTPSEIFNRTPWPTTKKEEAELVRGVRAAIWAEMSGGI